MDQNLTEWLEESERLLALAVPQERLAAVCALYAEIAMSSSVQGEAINGGERKAFKDALAKHVVRATGQFFQQRQR